MIIPNEDLTTIQELYDRGLPLQAHARAESFGPLRSWQGIPARILAGRLARLLGANRLAHAMHYQAWRENRTNPQAIYYYTLAAMVRRDPWRLWQFMRAQGELAHGGPDLHAAWLALHATSLARLRDFEAAEAWLRRAEQAAPGNAWVASEAAEVFELEDRLDAALETLDRALVLRPWYRPAVQRRAHLLSLQDRLPDAVDLLESAVEHNQAAALCWQLAQLYLEQERHADALAMLDRFEAGSPLLEAPLHKTVEAQRCGIACRTGNDAGIARHAAASGSTYYKKLAERLTQPGTPRSRKLLPVGFVRQHHLTCAPATFALLAAFWKMPVDHLELADEVTYDGTPTFVERAWAEDHGWAVRECTLTWDCARTLIDRGVPFTLNTVTIGNGHAQAVIGYDELRGTLLVRDPNIRRVVEHVAEQLLEEQKPSGPHVSIHLPVAEVGRLDGLDLPDAALHDRLYHMQRALQRHNRPAAAEEMALLETAAPGHRLTLQGRLMLAHYDDDRRHRLETFEGLRALFPDDARVLLGLLDALRDLARPDDRVALLRKLAAEHADPVFAQQYAEELRHDATRRLETQELLRRALRSRPLEALNFHILADFLWDRRAFEDALMAYRFGACLDDKNEHFVEAYFFAARHLKRTAEAMRLLQDRSARYRRRSSQPVRTLFRALELQGLADQGFEALDSGFKQRPDDGELALFAAEAHARYGHFARAEQFLAAARPGTKRSAWLRVAAELESLRGEPAAAEACWRQATDAAPLDLQAQRELARSLEAAEGRAAALDHLHALTERFPHHLGMLALYIEWLREEPPESGEPVLRRFLELDPLNAWAIRELAWNLALQDRLDEAFAQAESARRLAPADTACASLFGLLHERTGRIAEAREAFRAALRLDVNDGYAATRLMALCNSAEERREAMHFYRNELARQVVHGEGLIVFRHHARGVLDDVELLSTLREAHAARPDLWQAWSALAGHLLDLQRHTEALDLSRQATARFPLVPRLWLDRAHACRALKDEPGELDALQQACAMAPRWGTAVRALAERHGRVKDWAAARALLESAAARDPLDPAHHGHLAEVLWELGGKREALAHVERALALDPGYEWAWHALLTWGSDAGEPRRATETARSLVQRRPGDARAWLALARCLEDDKDVAERHAALERCLKLEPRNQNAHDLKACVHAGMQQWDAALAACQPPVYGITPPLELRARAAWVRQARGELAEALAGMREVLREAPRYQWGQLQLVKWLHQGDDHAAFLQAASRLAEIDASNPVAHGYLGDARQRSGDRVGARAAFEAALVLDPGYLFAGAWLFDLHFEDSNRPGARQALEAMQRHPTDPLTLSREVRLATLEMNRTLALDAFDRLLAAHNLERDTLGEAIEALDTAALARQANERLDRAAAAPQVQPAIAATAIERLARRHRWSEATRLAAGWLDHGADGLHAAGRLLALLAEAQERSEVVNFVEQHRHPLHKHDWTWGFGGYAFATIGSYSRCIHWLSDWSNRPKAMPWMLSNLTLALVHGGQLDEALRVARHALTLPPDHTLNTQRCWAGLLEGLHGRTSEAEAALKEVHFESLKPFEAFLNRLALTVAKTLGPQSSALPDFDVLRASLQQAETADPSWRSDPLQRKLYLQVAKRVRVRTGTFAASLWYVYQRLRLL